MANFVQNLGGRTGYPVNTGLQSGYGSASAISQGLTMLDQDMINKLMQWQPLFQNGAMQGTTEILQRLIQENGGNLMGLVGTGGGAQGPVLTRSELVKKILIPLMVTYSGLSLTYQQRNTLKALMGLVSVPHHPRSLPLNTPTFLMRVKQADQNLAVKGNFQTKVGSVGNRYFDVQIGLQSKTAGFNIGEQELFWRANPDDIVTFLGEQMQALEVTWELTLIREHAEYCAKLPTLGQRMMMKTLIHEPVDAIGKLLNFIFVELAVLGCVNRNDMNLVSVLQSCSQILAPTTKDIVAVATMKFMTDKVLPTEKVNVQVGGESVVYDTHNPSGMDGFPRFGVTNTNYMNNVRAITDQSASTSAASSDAVPGPNTALVERLPLGNGSNAYLLEIDGTPLAGVDEETCDKPLRHRGVIRTFFTVGACPALYGSLNNLSFFNGDRECKYTPKKLLQADCGTTYYMDLDKNGVRSITVRDLNMQMASDDLFNPTKAFEAFRAGMPLAVIGLCDEASAAKLISATDLDRKKSQLSLLETDPRNMFIKTAHDIQGDATKVRAGTEYVYMVSRGILGHMSFWSSFDNEMVRSVSALCAIFQDNLENLTTITQKMSEWADEVTPDHVRGVRGLADIDTVAKGMNVLEAIIEDPTVMSDPIVQFIFLDTYKLVSSSDVAKLAGGLANNVTVGGHQVNNPLGTQQEAENFMKYWQANSTYFMQLVNMIRGAHQELRTLFKTLFNNTVSYNIITSMSDAFIEIPAGMQNHKLILQMMYGWVCTSICSQVLAGRQGAAMELLPTASRSCSGFRDGVFVGENHVGVAAGPNDMMYELWHDYVLARRATRFDYFRPLFFRRIAQLKKKFATVPVFIVLGMIHYTTVLSNATQYHILDSMYPSGLAYMVVRQKEFQAHSLGVMPPKSVRFIYGNRGTAFPVDSFAACTMKQIMETGMCPMSLENIGLKVNGAYISDVKGNGNEWDPTKEGAFLVFDCYNSMCPEGMFTYQPGAPFISAFGRFDNFQTGAAINATDPVTGLATYCPTAFFGTSLMHRIRSDAMPDSPAVRLFNEALRGQSFMKSIPAYVQQLLGQNVTDVDLFKRAANDGNRPDDNVFTPTFAGLFTEDYVVGNGGSRFLTMRMISDEDVDLTPRILSMGSLSANAVFSSTAVDTKFMNNYVKGGPVVTINSNTVGF